MWDNYRHMGVTSGPWEVNQMSEALQAMKEDWRNRPTLLRKAGPIFEKGSVSSKTQKRKLKHKGKSNESSAQRLKSELENPSL